MFKGVDEGQAPRDTVDREDTLQTGGNPWSMKFIRLRWQSLTLSS